MKSPLLMALQMAFDPKSAFKFGNTDYAAPGTASDGLSTPSQIERTLRDTPIVNALFGQKIADQMSADRWRDDLFALTGKSEDNDYYPHLSGINYGGQGAMNVLNALKQGLGTVTSMAGALDTSSSAAKTTSSVVPTPYNIDNDSNLKLRNIYG